MQFCSVKIREAYSQKDVYVYRWLLTGAVLIMLMVVIGGITRLTQSGLSMVKWEPVMGTIPPMNEESWNEVFDLYKQSPEFLHYNSDFSLSDFKQIYFWEYLHRLIGRVIGMVFLVPFIFFWLKGYFKHGMKRKVILIFVWGAFQGVLGWLMVKSGLVDKPHVSHYRLAAHLITALGLMCYIFWVALELKYEVVTRVDKKLRNISLGFMVLVFIQIIYGAFVAGLKAGKGYNTFPKMGANWIPSEFSIIYKNEGPLSLIESAGIVQLMHRLIAYLVVIVGAILFWKVKQNGVRGVQYLGLLALIYLIGLQFLLGVVTLIYAVPVTMGVVHQFGAILVLLASIFTFYSLKKNN